MTAPAFPGFAYGVPMPAGADVEAAEGLPSFMTVGRDADGPWSYCTIHQLAHHGWTDVHAEVRAAWDHVTARHGRDGAR
jgi:hypothetical protein